LSHPSRDDEHADAVRGGVRRYALRLNGQLLLGYTRIHSFKVKFFQEDIKAITPQPQTPKP